ncbi:MULTISPECIES: hypothetical protein [unclassified Streptomyces]|uniref:Secreted protein n=1 Tax=Streptomyces machairae TaxID=3134109 RepID=A0ABU8UUW8_9ACTN|nr:hypothetical protein OG331_05875 [Streptomyces sp. NBC_01017]
MRSRATAAAATCALALVVAVPGPASAEILGNFYYTYTDASGAEEQANVEGLPTATCVNLPEAADPRTEFREVREPGCWSRCLRVMT